MGIKTKTIGCVELGDVFSYRGKEWELTYIDHNMHDVMLENKSSGLEIASTVDELCNGLYVRVDK